MKYIIMSYCNREFYQLHHANVFTFLQSLDEGQLFHRALKASLLNNVESIENKVQKLSCLDRSEEGIKHHYVLNNPLSPYKTSIEFQKYTIIVESENKNNIFFDIIYHNLKNYVIIEQYY